MDRRPTSQNYWPEATYVNLEAEAANYPRPLSRNLKNGLQDLPASVENISIPRPKYWERHQAQISNEFRFLEERNNTFSLDNPNGKYYSKGSYNKNLFVMLAVFQMILSIGFFLFACFRHFQLFNRSNTKTLLDFVKVEDYVASNKDGTDLIAIKLGTSLFLPAILQFFAGLTGLYPLRRRPPKSLYILNIIFSGLTILFWFRPVIYAVFELNLRNVQLKDDYDSGNHWTLIIVIFLLALDVFIINSLLLIYANSHLASSIRTLNHPSDLHLSVLSIVIGVLCVACSIYATAYTMTNVAEWGQNGDNLATLYGFGLRELIITSYILLISIFHCTGVVTRRKNIRQTSLSLELVGLICLFYEILNEDRLLAISHNVRVMYSQSINQPINPEILIVLYTFIIVLTIIMSIHVFLNTLNVFRSPVCDLYTPKTTTVQTIGQLHSAL